MQRLQTRAQFQAALAGKIVARTPHFALHQRRWDSHVSDVPSETGVTPAPWQALFAVAPEAIWLGAMVPKRWARRAVTRNSIKRQIYGLAAEWQGALPPGIHVLRLRSTFDRRQFLSARSEALRLVVREELLSLLEQAAKRSRPRPALTPTIPAHA